MLRGEGVVRETRKEERERKGVETSDFEPYCKILRTLADINGSRYDVIDEC